MDNLVCTLNISAFACFNCCSIHFADPLQDSLDAPMRYIGTYIALASGFCWFAMTSDLIDGFRATRLWFASKNFSLNSFSLTLLAVSMKLTVDLTGKMIGPVDKLARVTSLVFMSTAMANFMTCLGSMGNNEILLNMVSLGILVITIVVNVCIRNVQMSSFRNDIFPRFFGGGVLVEEIVCAGLMILVLLILCSLSIMVPTLRKLIDSSYHKVHSRSVSNMQVEWGNFKIDELKSVVTRYWVMVQTGSSQFVIARSAICVIPGILCFSMTSLTLVLLARLLPPSVEPPGSDYISGSRFNESDYEEILFSESFGASTSNYKGSILTIVLIQTIGVVLASIAPVCRWLTASHLKSQRKCPEILKNELKVEPYCTQLLLEWENSLLSPTTERVLGKRLVYSARRVFLKFCIAVQVVIVLTSKLLLLVSAVCAKLFLFCSCCSKESRDGMEGDISRYAVLLEGEGEMREKTLRNLCKEADRLMKLPKQKQRHHLIRLLKKSVNFNGVIEFDSSQSHEGAPNSWSLPIVTLTSMAGALPNIVAAKTNELLRGVSEGLKFVRLIEKTLDTNGESAGIIGNTSDAVWLKVELQSKWQGIDIREVRRNSKSSEDALRMLTDKARDIKENPESWKVNVIAAEAMHRICQTIIQDNNSKTDEQIIIEDNNSETEEQTVMQVNHNQTDEQLFERLSVMISDLFSACLTNLARAIIFKCQSSALKEREEIVLQAALLVAESEEIFEVLKERELPELDAEKAAYIEEWRRKLTMNDTENPGASVPAAATANQATG